MKKTILSAIGKFTFAVALLSAVAATPVQASFVGSGPKTASVQYIGASEDAVVFHVIYDNPAGNKFVVSIVDEEGTLVFEGSFSEKNFDKRFRLPKSDKNQLTFVIRDLKDVALKQSFQISTKVVEDVTVTRL